MAEFTEAMGALIQQPRADFIPAVTSLVAQDLADKSGRSFAVVHEGQLLPVRFAGFEEAYSHLQGLGATG